LDCLPDSLDIDKIVDRARSYQRDGDCISFIITRHPGFGGRSSQAYGLSIYFKEETKYTYCLDSNEWNKEVLGSKLIYDAYLIAQEEIDTYQEIGMIPYKISDLDELEIVMKEVEDSFYGSFFYGIDHEISSSQRMEIANSVFHEIRKNLEERAVAAPHQD
jgi:hypothetical protein